MTIDEAVRRRLLESVSQAVAAGADELTALDQAIGDGDHGINMRRGFQAVLENADDIAARPLPEALKTVGMKLVMKVGGASGPLYGTLIMELGKALAGDDPSREELSRALEAAVQAVKARGRSDAGEKTMLDVLVPLSQALADGGDGLLDSLPALAEQSAQATIPMQATRGRASFLGERSIGHMDPGARSTELLASAVCRTLKELT